jgi:prophage antirepressor-like protein
MLRFQNFIISTRGRNTFPQKKMSNPNCIIKAFENNNISILKENSDNKNNFLFKASDVAKILDLSQIRSSIQNFDEDEKVVRLMNDVRGVSQNTTYLTSRGVYRLLYSSKKSIAKKFRKWVSTILDDIIFNEGQELKKQLEKKDTQLLQLSIDKRLDKQNIFIREFGHDCVLVYIVKIKELENGEYIIRLGESRDGVLKRFNSHQSDYGKENVFLLDCFLVNNSKKFEKFLHENLSKHKVTTLQGHETENELFLVGKELAYSHILQLINKNIHKFNDNYVELEKLKTQHETLKLITSGNSNMEKLFELFDIVLDTNKKLLLKVDNLENSVSKLHDTLNSQETKTTSNFNVHLQTVGPRLQKINPETFQLVKLYETTTEAIKESNFILKRPSINKAIKECTIYQGFRWNTVDREHEAPENVQIEATKVTKIQNNGYIAKLNSTKKEILNVYLNRSVASLSNGYSSSASLDNVVKNDKLSKSNYYMLYTSVNIEVRDSFEDTHNKPILYKDGIGKYNTENVLVEEYVSKMDCYTQSDIGNKSLSKSLANGSVYAGFYYRHLGYKKSMIE